MTVPWTVVTVLCGVAVLSMLVAEGCDRASKTIAWLALAILLLGAAGWYAMSRGLI